MNCRGTVQPLAPSKHSAVRPRMIASVTRPIWTPCADALSRPAGAVREQLLPFTTGRLGLLSLLSRFDQTALVGEDDRLHSVTETQLGEHTRNVGLDGALPQEQMGRELRVALPGGE